MPLKKLQFAEFGPTNRSISADLITVPRQFDFKTQPEYDKGATAIRGDPLHVCTSAGAD